MSMLLREMNEHAQARARSFAKGTGIRAVSGKGPIAAAGDLGGVVAMALGGTRRTSGTGRLVAATGKRAWIGDWMADCGAGTGRGRALTFGRYPNARTANGRPRCPHGRLRAGHFSIPPRPIAQSRTQKSPTGRNQWGLVWPSIGQRKSPAQWPGFYSRGC
jgi:hypothetical protein